MKNTSKRGSIIHLIFRINLVIIGCISSLFVFANTDYIPQVIDINKADTTVFQALPGIGSKLASRIVSYREKLRGFYSIEQVSETYGLHDSVFQKVKSYFVVSKEDIGKININAAAIEELRTPYISYNLANAIYQYRLQHGPFTRLEDLRKIMIMDEKTYNKIIPYLSIG